MAVAFNNSGAGSASSGGATVTSYSFTASSGSDRLLLVSASQVGAGIASAVSYAGSALTALAINGHINQWRLIAPATGANTLSVTSTTYSSRLTLVADFTGVDQVTPLGTVATGSGTNNLPETASITRPTNGMLWGSCYQQYSPGNVALSATGNTTVAGQLSVIGEKTSGGYASVTGTLSWSGPNNAQWFAQGYPINAAAASGIPNKVVYVGQAIQRSQW